LLEQLVKFFRHQKPLQNLKPHFHLFEGLQDLAFFTNLKYNKYMIYFIIGLVLGLYAEWKWEIAKYIIESIKEHLKK
jgi:hypothetical protein